jgi:hypothetical protein
VLARWPDEGSVESFGDVTLYCHYSFSLFIDTKNLIKNVDIFIVAGLINEPLLAGGENAGDPKYPSKSC